MDVKTAVKEAIYEVIGKKDPADNASLIDDLGFDSLDIVELEIFLEEQFGHLMTVGFDIRAEKLYTVSDIVRHIELSRI